MLIAGIDIGSRSIEVALMDERGEWETFRVDTTFDPLSQSEKLLKGLSYDGLVATGYGRKLIAEHLEAGVITEIQAHARGARMLFPQCRNVLDIGGQDTKAISLGEDGRIAKFEMNDRCAAGTGKFLEFMALGLQVPLDEFGEFALGGREGTVINSMCTVFAETEATSLMARGAEAKDIALALHRSVVKRSLSMIRRVGLNGPLVFAGGVAQNPCMVELLQKELGAGVLVPPKPDTVGALGAARWGLDQAAGNGGGKNV